MTSLDRLRESELEFCCCWFDLTGNKAMVGNFLSELSGDGWRMQLGEKA